MVRLLVDVPEYGDLRRGALSGRSLLGLSMLVGCTLADSSDQSEAEVASSPIEESLIAAEITVGPVTSRRPVDCALRADGG